MQFGLLLRFVAALFERRVDGLFGTFLDFCLLDNRENRPDSFVCTENRPELFVCTEGRIYLIFRFWLFVENFCYILVNALTVNKLSFEYNIG